MAAPKASAPLSGSPTGWNSRPSFRYPIPAARAGSSAGSSILKPIFYGQRFRDAGKLDRHNLGNLFLVLSSHYGADITASIRALSQAVEAVGQVYPVSLDKIHLAVELSDGAIIRTEGEIDRPAYDRSCRISRAWLEPEGQIYEPARQAIESADYIVIGPGSLYCSIIAALLPAGVRQAVGRSAAKIIFVAGNAFELEGETGPERLSDFVYELQAYLPRKIDLVLYNNHPLSVEKEAEYRAKRWALFAPDVENLADYNIVEGDYERPDRGRPGLSDMKLGNILYQIIFYQTIWNLKKPGKKGVIVLK